MIDDLQLEAEGLQHGLLDDPGVGWARQGGFFLREASKAGGLPKNLQLIKKKSYDYYNLIEGIETD